MKPLILALLAVSCFGLTEYEPTQYHFGDRTVTTSEDLYMGRTHTSFPVTNLFDGSPATAWVFSGLKQVAKEESTADLWGGRYALGFQLGQGVTIDGIDLMNGYSKSTKTFAANRRVIEVAVYDEAQPYVDPKPLKVVRLADRQGWHHISLPRAKYTEISLVLREFAGPKDADIALSEMRFTDKDRKLPVVSGKAYTYFSGADFSSGFGFELRTVKGSLLATSDLDQCAWDHNYRYVAGLQSVAKSDRRTILWVADTKEGKLVYRGELPDSDQGYSLMRRGGTEEGPLEVHFAGRSLPVPYMQ